MADGRDLKDFCSRLQSWNRATIGSNPIERRKGIQKKQVAWNVLYENFCEFVLAHPVGSEFDLTGGAGPGDLSDD